MYLRGYAPSQSLFHFYDRNVFYFRILDKLLWIRKKINICVACYLACNGDIHIASHNSSELKENSKQTVVSRDSKVNFKLQRGILSFKIRNNINLDISVTGKI